MNIERTGEAAVYPGRELEAMSFAVKYHRWILDVFAPYLGARLVEVGAGSGSFSELLLEREWEALALVEPSEAMHGELCRRVARLQTSTPVAIYNSVFRRVAARVKSEHRPDSIIYVNVLEHIADDRGELEVVHRTLGPGGRLFVFVPALRWLFGGLDESVGHVRRYTKGEVEEKCRGAGFRVLRSDYFDLAGVAPWWVKYRLLGSSSMEPGAVAFYDRYVVPVTRAAESLVRPPIGKNVILVAEKV